MANLGLSKAVILYHDKMYNAANFSFWFDLQKKMSLNSLLPSTFLIMLGSAMFKLVLSFLPFSFFLPDPAC